MLKVWLIFKRIILIITLCLYGNFAIDVLFGVNVETNLKISNVHSPRLKLALILFAIMCTIEAVILFRDNYFKDEIDIDDYSPQSLGDVLIFDYDKDESKLFKKALINKYIKFTTVLLFLVVGVGLIFMTDPLLDEGMVSGFYRSFAIFKIFFILLSSIMVLDYSIRILRIKKIIKRNE